MLPRKAIAINLSGGLDTKSDKKHVLPGSLTKMQNAVFRKNNAIAKRTGHTELPNTDVSGTALGVGTAITTFNDELIQYNNQLLYSYSSGASSWVDKGEIVLTQIKTKQIVKNTATQTQSDSAIVNGVGVYAWEDSRGGVRASVFDETTGAALLSDVELDSSATRVRCAAFSNFLFVFYYKSGVLYVRRLNPLLPVAFDAAITVSNQVNTTNPVYDVYSYDDLRIMFAHNIQEVQEVTTITPVADVSDSLDGTTFILQDEDGSVAFWIDVDDSGTTIPAEASAADRAVEITTIVTNDTASTVQGKLVTAINADASFGAATGTGVTVVVTDAVAGARDAPDESTSGFTIETTTSGVDVGIKVGWLSNVPAVLTGVLAAKTISEAAENCIAIVRGPAQTFYLAYENAGDLKCTILNNGANTLYSPFTVDTIAGSYETTNITGYKVSDDDGVQLLYEIDATGVTTAQYNYVKECKVNDDGTVGTATVFKRQVGLWSEAFIYEDRAYVALSHDTTLQATYFVCRDDGVIVGVQQYTNGGGITTRPILANISNPSSTSFSWSLLKKNQIQSENATIYTPTGVMKTTLEFTEAFNARQLGNNLLIPGGVLNMYDGENVVEHGFLLYPENLTTTPATSGGSLADGSYVVYALYEWTDQYGQIHRSQPSVGKTATVSGGSGNGKITVVVPYIPLTRKDGTNRTDISIVGYVTDTDGTVAYRFTSISSPTYNDVTSDTVSLVVTTVSTSNEILYTTGEVLPNTPAPACSVIEIFQNRAWIGGLEESNAVRFSKENKVGEPVEFADDFVKAIESAGGRVTSLATIDDKILFLKKDRFYYTYGDGPNNTNTLGGFSEIKSATVDVGCDVPQSIADIPNGIILKTTKGFYAIDSTLNPQYIGAPVEDYNSLTVRSGNLLANTNEVSFGTNDGDLLTYNYYYGKWSSASGLKANGATIFGTSHVILKSDGRIFKQDDTTWKDSLDSYRMVLESGWISLSGLTDFKRIYELMIVGDYKSVHKLRVSIAYDYVDAWIHTGTYDPVTKFPIEYYGDDSPYGETGTVYGGKSNAYIVRVKMKRQKCTAFRFKIEELVTTATEGTHESLTLSDVGVLIGLKKGVSKVSRSRILGVS